MKAPKTLRFPGPPRPESFERALAELLLSKGRVSRIAVTLDGTEVVLFDAAAAAARAA